MNTTDFVKKTMDQIFSTIEDISLKYAFEEGTGFHIIEVCPLSALTDNVECKKMLHQFRTDFHKEFPMEDIIISKASKLHDMNNVVYELLQNVAADYNSTIERKSYKEAWNYKFNKLGGTCYATAAGERNFALAA